MSKKEDGKDEDGFLEKLKQFKEFITILIFFAGGVLWVYGYFATKNQVTTLACVMEQNVKMLRGKMEYQFFNDLLEENRHELKSARREKRRAKKDNMPYEGFVEKELDLTEQREDLKKDREKFKNSMEEALNSLTSNGCS